MRLEDLVIALRSKNAGPCLLTLDLMFPDPAPMRRVEAQLERIRLQVAALYRVEPDQVQAHVFPPALAIKFTLPRSRVSGDVGDCDVYGAQQHAPMLGITI